MMNLDDIRRFYRGRIALREPLSKYTSFRIGGPADFYLEPEDRDDAIALGTYFQTHGIPFIVLGKGSNVLVSDDGIRGVVINVERGLGSMMVDDDIVTAEAGVSVARFVDFCINRGLRGVEMLPGIPGTVGGAVMMNASAYGGQISDYLVDVQILRAAQLTTVSKEQAGFQYRDSGFHGDLILSARFRLPKGDKAEVMKQRRELLIKRNRAQPVNYPNSGSMFKNPAGTFAAKLIDEAGLKGTRCGNAQISERHANFILNLGGATANDVLALIEIARKTVFEKFGISLELEVKLLGFTEEQHKEVHS